METTGKIKTSFIPKEAISNKRSIKKPTLSIFLMLALVLLLAIGLSAVGIFLYKSTFETRLASKKESLERAKSAFEPSIIIELKRLSNRTKAIAMLMNKHSAPSRVFDLLEELTLTSVRFDRFSYNEEGDQISIKMGGEANSYASIVLQADSFSENFYIKDFMFSNLGLDQKGKVTFDFTTDIERPLISYREMLNIK